LNFAGKNSKNIGCYL
jgi:hypothetical protein